MPYFCCKIIQSDFVITVDSPQTVALVSLHGSHAETLLSLVDVFICCRRCDKTFYGWLWRLLSLLALHSLRSLTYEGRVHVGDSSFTAHVVVWGVLRSNINTIDLFVHCPGLFTIQSDLHSTKWAVERVFTWKMTKMIIEIDFSVLWAITFLCIQTISLDHMPELVELVVTKICYMSHTHRRCPSGLNCTHVARIR